MALIFSPDKAGMATGIPISGAATASSMKLGVDYNLDRWSGEGFASGVVRNLKEKVDVAAKFYSSDSANIGGVSGRDLVTMMSPALAAMLAWKYGAGDSGIDLNPAFANSVEEAYYASDTTAFWTKQAQTDLDDLIKPMGLITSMTVQFKEAANIVGPVVEAGTAMVPGVASIGGVVFEKTCDTKGANKGRHGVEPILEYYYYHRVSNNQKMLTKTTLKFGQTVLKGWVVGVDIEPQNMDFRIWKWTINLAVDPMYKPKPSRNPKTGGELLQGKETYDGYNRAAYARQYGSHSVIQ